MPHRAWIPLLAVASLVAFAATGLAGDGEADVHPLTSAGDELVPAEVPVTVGWVLTDDEGQPAFHQDARVHVTHEGDTLLETVPSSGHDYDGVDPYRVSFPEPGNFTVEAEIVDDGEVRQLAYEGTVGPAPSEELDLAIEAPDEVAPGERVTLGAEVTDEEGRPVEEVETTLRLQRTADRFEVLKTQLAGAEPTMGYSFARTGTFQLVAVAQPVPGGQATGFAPVSERVSITVEGPPSPPSVGAPVEQPLRNDRDTAEQDADGADLFVTYDPYTSIGPHGRLRLGMLTLDETDRKSVV